MNRTGTLALLAALPLISFAPVARQDPGIEVAGRILDADGKPVAGSSAATSWQLGADRRGSGAFLADADGNFRGKWLLIEFWGHS